MSEGAVDGASVAAAGGEAGSGSGSNGGGGSGQLADVQRQLAALESRYAALVAKHDDTENDLAFQKKRVESAVAKITQDKDEEIAQLKQAFAEVSDKRKAAFTQMKERLEQAGAVVKTYAATQEQLESSLSAARSQLETTQRQLSEREAELSALQAQRGHAEQSLSSRTQELEAQLSALRAESSSSSATIAELQTELAAARARVENLEERVKGKPPAKCSIAVEDSGKAAGQQDGTDVPLFPGVLENGRSVKFSWSLSGNVRIQWFRSFRGSAWELIPGKNATRPSYLVSADDIGACLRAEATHTVNGAMVFAEAGPVHPSHALLAALQEPLRKLDASFTVESGSGGPAGGGGGAEADKKRGILLNKEKIKLQDAKGKTVAKKEWGEHVKVTLDGDSERRFSVQIESNGPVVPYAAANQRMRDLIVVALRSFLYVITKHGGRLNKDMDHLLALSLHIRTLNEQTYNRAMSTVPASPAKRQPSISNSASGSKAPLPPGAKGAAGQSGTTPSKRPSDAAGGGGAQGSAPSTPVSHSAATPQQPGGGGVNDRRQSGAADDEWGGFNLPPTAAAAAPAASAAAPSNGAVRRNAEGQEVDEQGFIVTKNRGFDDIAPKGGDDSDDEAGGADMESRGPAIKVQINEQGRAPASAEALKSMTSGLTLSGPKGKKGKKGAKPGKKGKKDDEEGGGGGGGGSIGSLSALNGSGGSLDGLGLSTAGISISPPLSTGSAAIMDNSVPGLPPLTATTTASASDPSDPFADFFK